MVWLSDVPIVISPPHSAFIGSKNASDRAYSNVNCDLVSNFQRNFCSNFVCICCYVRLPSLHDLYDHVEEAHIKPADIGSWPPKVFSELTNLESDDDTVLAIAYSTQDYDSEVYPCEDTFHLDYCTTCDAEYLPQCPPLRRPLARHEQTYPSPPPPNVTPGPAAPEHGPQEGEGPEAESLKLGHESSVGPIRSRLRNRERRRAIPPPSPRKTAHGKSRSTASEPRANSASQEISLKPGHRKRILKKDMIYNCPTPGCIKTYRNANGLKYHKEKGTCVISEEFFANQLSIQQQISAQAQQNTMPPARLAPPYFSSTSTPPMDYLTPPTSPLLPPKMLNLNHIHGSSLHVPTSFPNEVQSDDEIYDSMSTDEVSRLSDASYDLLARSRRKPESALLRSPESPLSSCSRSLSPLSVFERLASPCASPVEICGFTRVGMATGRSETSLPSTVFAPAVALTLDRSSSCEKGAGFVVPEEEEDDADNYDL